MHSDVEDALNPGSLSGGYPNLAFPFAQALLLYFKISLSPASCTSNSLPQINHSSQLRSRLKLLK